MNRFLRIAMYVTVALVLLLFSGCGSVLAWIDGNPGSSDSASVRLISESEALEIAANHFGIKAGSRDGATGYVMSYQIQQVATLDNPYYCVALQWMVEVDGKPSHQSVLDTVTINALSGKAIIQIR